MQRWVIRTQKLGGGSSGPGPVGCLLGGLLGMAVIALAGVVVVGVALISMVARGLLAVHSLLTGGRRNQPRPSRQEEAGQRDVIDADFVVVERHPNLPNDPE